MTCTVPFMVEFTRSLSGSRPVRMALGAVSGAALVCALAGPVRAESAPPAALPTVSITTEAVVPDVILPAAAITTHDATPAPKPVVHHAHHIALQTVDTASLSAPALGNPVGHARVIEARATTLRPAPLPDEDLDAPGPDAQAIAAQQQASLSPSFYGNKDHFSGDGFSAGSNLEGDKNNRRKPGGGMSLSIPMQ